MNRIARWTAGTGCVLMLALTLPAIAADWPARSLPTPTWDDEAPADAILEDGTLEDAGLEDEILENTALQDAILEDRVGAGESFEGEAAADDQATADDQAPAEDELPIDRVSFDELAAWGEPVLTHTEDTAALPGDPHDVSIGQLVEEYLAAREAGLIPQPPAAAQSGRGGFPSLTPRWNHGLEWITPEEDFRLHIGGRYQFDTAAFAVDDAVQENLGMPYGDGVDFRRGRFRMDGTIYKIIDFAAEIDFVNSFRSDNRAITITNAGFTEASTVALTDFWWQLRDVPILGAVKIGQQKEGIGFEHLVSSRFLPFMERSFNQDTFYGGTFNGFTPGISAMRNYGPHDMGLIHYGLYKPVNNVFGQSTGTGDYAVVGRMTRLLAWEEDGRYLVHVGVSGKQSSAVSQAGVDGRVQTYRTRDAVRSGLSQDWPVPAGISLYGDDIQQVNAELAVVAGPWTLQSEYLVSGHQDARVRLSDPVAGTVVYHGGYIQLLRYLTDDYDRYDKKTGAFGRVLPSQNLARSSRHWGGFGGGAWQLGARYNFLDLNDQGFNGGVLHNQTYGINWFLNPNIKAQFNYFATYRDVAETITFSEGSGWIHGFGTRVAMDF